MCAIAAKYGQLQMLQWLRTHGYPWTCSTTLNAATYGHLDVLQWSIDNGCRLEFQCFTNAVKGGHIEILEYLQSRRHAPYIHDVPAYLHEAAIRGHQLKSLMWLHTHGYPVPRHLGLLYIPKDIEAWLETL
jgi:hypothetical protein